MSPHIALVIGILFIASLFHFESRNEVDSSKAVWIPTMWFFFASTRGFTQWLDILGLNIGSSSYHGSGANTLDGSPIDRTILSILIIIGLIVILKRGVKFDKLIANNFWLFILFGFMFMSLLWSNYPLLTIKRSVRTIGAFVMALIVLSEQDPEEASSLVIKRVVFIVIPISIIFIKYFPEIGLVYDWVGSKSFRGAAGSKNVLSQIAYVGGLFLVWDLLVHKKSGARIYNNISLILLSLWILFGIEGSRSMTGVILFTIGMIVLVGVLKFEDKPSIVVTYVPFVVFIITVLLVIFSLYFHAINDSEIFTGFVTAVGRDATLTDRGILWNELLHIGINNPILGEGYGSFWVGEHAKYVWNIFKWKPNQSHNGYIGIFLELGLLGLLFMVLTIISCIKTNALNLYHNYTWSSLKIALIIIIILNNFTESIFLKGYHGLWFIFLLFSVKLTVKPSPP